MNVQQVRVESTLKIVWWEVRSGLQEFFYVPPLGHFLRRARQRARRLCLASTVSCVAAARQAVRDTQQEDIYRVAAAIAPTAKRCAHRFKLDPDELANETLVRILPSIRKNYYPPNSDDDGTQSQCLQKYVKTPVYRTAYALLYGRTTSRRHWNFDESVLSQVEDEVDMFSEIAMRDEFEWLMKSKLLKDQHRCRLTAIANSESIVDAAKLLDINPDTLRRWCWQIRQRLRN